MVAKLQVVRKKHLTVRPPKAGRAIVKVGFPQGTANVEKAVWNEFGTRGGASGGGWGGPIPERPFMRNSVRNNEGKYRRVLKASAARILNGTAQAPQILAQLGIEAQGDIQDEIRALTSPPNSPVTIALKGSSNPLIDTGNMRQSVTYKVEA